MNERRARPRRSAFAIAASQPGPGDLTLASIVCFTIGAYGVAAGAAVGEQTVVAVGVFAFALFIAGIVWPIVTLARTRVEVSAPSDATVGDSVELHVRVLGHTPRLEVRVLDPIGPWWRTTAPSSGTIPHVATRRGVFSEVRVQLRTSMPLGIFVRLRTLRVRLPEPIAVAPRASAAAPMLRPVPDDAAATPAYALSSLGSDTVRAVRPYVPGDPARMVHWPTSARRGVLVVREQEPPTALGVALLVDLNGPNAEAAASHAAGIAIATLAVGGVVWCGTAEAGGPVGDIVADPRSVGRRLAFARGGALPTPPRGWSVEMVRA
ncbi:MAG TPA: DUF58 domain-containing protein [Acidimicrobiia bacterium]|nr:DUF58 domain-containing protein [Acidimicrobiia bacterium]